MSGNGSHHLYMEGTGWLYPNGGKSTIFSTQTVIPQMKTGFLIFSEIDRKSSKIKSLNDFD